MKHPIRSALMVLLWSFLSISVVFAVDVEQGKEGDISLMQQFDTGETIAPERAISDDRKHEILFLMGASLLLLLLTTGALGIAMGVFEKDVFVWHMLSAGLTITLALTHAVVSFVWFYPK
ncbi:MAG: hypothetical protein Q9M22_07610 [Mariprofundaceae bacterium]|nr:hypothetical protein [Mariprofundaceae bacterium]